MAAELVAALAAITYLVGGALLIFIWNAYKATRDSKLIFLAMGLFLLVFGSNIGVFYWVVFQVLLQTKVFATIEEGYFVSLLFQLPGIFLVFWSALRK
ncbi:MAG: hypothetical protein QXO51_03155 [Halobacteria archaeon]